MKRENAHRERGSFDGVALDDKDVAGGHLLQIGVRLGVQIDHIRVARLLRRQLDHQHLLAHVRTCPFQMSDEAQIYSEIGSEYCAMKCTFTLLHPHMHLQGQE